jgi:hypothetical protein
VLRSLTGDRESCLEHVPRSMTTPTHTRSFEPTALGVSLAEFFAPFRHKFTR